MEKKNNQKSMVITVSIVAGLLVCALILVLSLVLPGDNLKNAHNSASGDIQSTSAAEDYLVSSDAVAGQNSANIVREITAEEIVGTYIDERDGWCYKFEYDPDEVYDGVFYTAFENVLSGEVQSTGNGDMLVGHWKLENGEIKLYSGDEQQSSLWSCGDYIVDSQAYFVGNINPDADKQQAMFVCKDAQNGDARVLNIYNDGKVIMEVLNADADDREVSSDARTNQLVAGTYVKHDNVITITINNSSQDFYAVDGGLAKWIYTKKID